MTPELRQQYEELCTVIDYSEGTQFRKNWVKKDILKTIRRTGKLDTTIYPPTFRWNLCAARLRSGRFDNWDGWEFRSNWAITFQGFNCPENERIKIPKWCGQPTKHLVVLGEQGIGDEILFSSALPELIVRAGPANIEFQTYPRLIPIIERSFRIRCTERKVLSQVKEGEYVIALADLFRFYRRDKTHFPRKPFLKPNPELVETWRRKLESLREKGKPLIGIAWMARHGVLNPFDLMDREATYVNLQYGASHPNLVQLDQDPLTDMEGHLALIANLDRVVSVTQTVVHVCGSLGVPCEAIIPPRGTGEVDNFLWYYGTGGPMVPYGSVFVYPSIEEFRCRSR